MSSAAVLGSKIRATLRSVTLWWWLIAALPTLIMFWAGACFVWNHFLLGPYLHDSGWYSAIIYRQGFLPDNPPVVHPLREYYGLHVSLLVSITSLVSYLVPLERVPFYCLFQGLIYAPLGAVIAILARGGPASAASELRLADAWKVAAVSLLFAVNGQVFACIGYPHYEIVISAAACIMVGAASVGRERLAWIGFALTAGSREDGGFHAAAFAAAMLLCDWTGRAFPIPRRTVLKMLVGGLLFSVLCFAVQKAFFETADLFRHEYLGHPTYGHLTPETLWHRLEVFAQKARFIFWPLAATSLIAIVRRDFRYLFGWLVEMPWLLLNLFAAQQLKSEFEIYTGFPFVASIFWVGAYARLVTPRPSAHRWLIPVALVSAFSTLGAYSSRPDSFLFTLRTAILPTGVPYAGIARFSRDLAHNPDAYGVLLLDPGMASWALDRMPAERRLFDLRDARSLSDFDGITFFRNGLLAPLVTRFVNRSPFTDCARIPQTEVFLCRRPGWSSLPPGFVTATLDG